MIATFIRRSAEPKGRVASIVFNSNFFQPLNGTFAAFNRGSGSEVEFAGPSMSVGDVIVLEEAPRGKHQPEAYVLERDGFSHLYGLPLDLAVFVARNPEVTG